MKRKEYMRGLAFGIIVTTVLFSVVKPYKNAKIPDSEVIKRAKELGYVKADDASKDKISNLISEAYSGTPKPSEPVTTPDPKENPNTEEPQPTGSADISTTPEPTKEVSPVVTPVTTPESTATPTPKPTATPTPKPTATPTPKPTATPTPKPTATPTPKPTEAPTSEPLPTKIPEVSVTPGATVPEKTVTKKDCTVTVSQGDYASAVAEKLKQAGAIDNKSEFLSYMNKNGFATEINIGTFKIPAGTDYRGIAKILTGK